MADAVSNCARKLITLGRQMERRDVESTATAEFLYKVGGQGDTPFASLSQYLLLT